MSKWRHVRCQHSRKRQARDRGAQKLGSAAIHILTPTVGDWGKNTLAAWSKDVGRFGSSSDEEAAALYLSTAFVTDPIAAIEALTIRLNSLDQEAQTRLGQRLLPRLFGGLPFDRRDDPPRLPFEVLERLIVVAFRTVRIDEDTTRPGGIVYSPDDRDRAQEARSNAFSQFANTPGRTTFVALNRLAELRDFAVGPQRLRELALARAARDSEHAAWPPSEPYALEQRFDVAPTTPRDLQETAASRLSDIQHALLHGDFAQGRTIKKLPNETEVQKWWRPSCEAVRAVPTQWSVSRTWPMRRSPTSAFGPKPRTPACLSR